MRRRNPRGTETAPRAPHTPALDDPSESSSAKDRPRRTGGGERRPQEDGSLSPRERDESAGREGFPASSEAFTTRGSPFALDMRWRSGNIPEKATKTIIPIGVSIACIQQYEQRERPAAVLYDPLQCNSGTTFYHPQYHAGPWECFSISLVSRLCIYLVYLT